MIYTPHNSKGLKLVDHNGTSIPYAYEFNDETNEVKCFLTGVNPKTGKPRVVVDHGQVIKVSAIVEGAKMIPRSG